MIAVAIRASAQELTDIECIALSELLAVKLEEGLRARYLRKSAPVDPWDLASEELNETCALPREVPQFYGRDRGEWDAADDRSDLQPFSKTEKP
jgi:hypothetical protein